MTKYKYGIKRQNTASHLSLRSSPPLLLPFTQSKHSFSKLSSDVIKCFTFFNCVYKQLKINGHLWSRNNNVVTMSVLAKARTSRRKALLCEMVPFYPSYLSRSLQSSNQVLLSSSHERCWQFHSSTENALDGSSTTSRAARFDVLCTRWIKDEAHWRWCE